MSLAAVLSLSHGHSVRNWHKALWITLNSVQAIRLFYKMQAGIKVENKLQSLFRQMAREDRDMFVSSNLGFTNKPLLEIVQKDQSYTYLFVNLFS